METFSGEGWLIEDYSLDEDYFSDYQVISDNDEEDDEEDDPEAEEDGQYEPEIGIDFWQEGFDLESWEYAFEEHMNCIKIPFSSQDPVTAIRDVIGYEFINENLLRQAFTRRAFGLEYGVGDSEQLEFLGDSILNTVVTREMVRQFSEVFTIKPQAPFRSRYSEGEMTKIRSRFVNKEHLAARATELGLDKYILYGTGETKSDSAAEDMIEALLGAVAVDCEWDWQVLESVADRLVCIQITAPDEFLKTSFYDLFNAWHQRHFGRMPEYEVYGGESTGKRHLFYCTIRFSVPENDKGVRTWQRIDVNEETRGKAREYAARRAYYFVMDQGLWINLADSGIVPSLENSINQLQELYQKKYLEDKAEYVFEELPQDRWRCSCTCGGVNGYGEAGSKTGAKKKASYMVLVRMLSAAGICKKEWKEEMYRMTLS
jgi:ribonuclease-3